MLSLRTQKMLGAGQFGKRGGVVIPCLKSETWGTRHPEPLGISGVDIAEQKQLVIPTGVRASGRCGGICGKFSARINRRFLDSRFALARNDKVGMGAGVILSGVRMSGRSEESRR